MWLQRKIEQRVKGGVEHFRISAQSGWTHLQDDISSFGADNKFTRLVWPLEEGADPDDAFSGIPYEKGFNLLWHLESIVGSVSFESFAKQYIAKYKFGTVTSGEFKDCFVKFFESVTTPKVKTALAALDWDQLLLGPGLPLSVPDFSNSLSVASVDLGRRWVQAAEQGLANGAEGAKAADIAGWSTQQKIIFLEHLLTHLNTSEKPFPDSFLRALDQAYALTVCSNAEIKFRWQSICIRCEAAWIVPHVAAFISSQGRMKYVRPLYRALLRSSVGASTAAQTFKKHSGMYHSICRKMLQADFKAAGVEVDISGGGAGAQARGLAGLSLPLLVTGAFVAIGLAVSRGR